MLISCVIYRLLQEENNCWPSFLLLFPCVQWFIVFVIYMHMLWLILFLTNILNTIASLTKQEFKNFISIYFTENFLY